MDVLNSVLAAIIGIVGLVIFYAVYNQYSMCIGAAAAIIVIVPIAIAAGIIIYVLYHSFGAR